MAWAGVYVKLRSYTADGVTALQGAINNTRAIMDGIVSANPAWSIAQVPVEFVVNKQLGILTHTSGAQLAVGAAIISSTLVNAANEYTATTYNQSAVCFRPSISTGGTLSINPGVNDPWTTATWCADAGAYKFVAFTFRESFYIAENTAIFVAVDLESANLILFPFFDDSYASSSDYCIICIDGANGISNFVQTYSATDTKKSMFAAMYMSSSTFSSAQYKYIQYKDSTGADVEDGLLSAYQLKPTTTITENFYLKNAYDNSIGKQIFLYGLRSEPKGIIDKNIMIYVREDLGFGQVVRAGDIRYFHYMNGLCFRLPDSVEPPA